MAIQLYLIGGAARSGKSTLAQRLAAELNVTYIPLDLFHNALQFGAGQQRPIPLLTKDESRKLMRPLSDRMLQGFIESGRTYVVEGGWFKAETAAMLENAGSTRCCFLGYPNASDDDIEDRIQLEQSSNSYLKDESAEYLRKQLRAYRGHSIDHRSACEAAEIKYFDTSKVDEMDKVITSALDFMIKPLRLNF